MKDDKCLRRLNQYSHVKCFHAHFKRMLWEKHLVFVHFKQASNKNSPRTQLVSDKSRALLIDKTFSKWQCDKRISISVKFRQNIQFTVWRRVNYGQNISAFIFRFVYLRCLPNINRFRLVALVNGFEFSMLVFCFFSKFSEVQMSAGRV